MGRLTESAAEQLLASQAFDCGSPGFVGAAIDRPGPPGVAARRALRHGFLVTRADGTATVSGPPSPGLESCLARMADDLATLPTIATEPGAEPQLEIPLGVRPGGGAAAGIRVGLEAGLDGGGPLGLPRRWRLAHTLAPVLAAAFANSPSPGGWRSTRAARHRDRAVLIGQADQGPTGIGAVVTEPTGTESPDAGSTGIRDAGSGLGGPGADGIGSVAWSRGFNPCAPELGGIRPQGIQPGGDPRAEWAAFVMDARAEGDGPSLRESLRAGDTITEDELWRRRDGLRAPVRARGHLELDFVDGQDGDGWRVAVAVIATLLDDPVAATAAEEATGHFAYGVRVWERAARDALADAQLAAAARDCFVAAYAALARRGAPRDLRDAVAAYMDRFVMRGRCPADDRIALGRTRALEAS